MEVCIEYACHGELDKLRKSLPGLTPELWEIHFLYRCAAGNGCLHVVQWLHENGYEWNWWLTNEAITFNQPEILKYALEHGCPVREES